MRKLFGTSLDDLSPPSRKLLQVIRGMCAEACREEKIPASQYRFTRRDIRGYSGWTDFQVKNHIRELTDMEYIWSEMGRKGKEYVYELLYSGGGEDGDKFLIGLTDIEDLQQKAVQRGISE